MASISNALHNLRLLLVIILLFSSMYLKHPDEVYIYHKPKGQLFYSTKIVKAIEVEIVDLTILPSNVHVNINFAIFISKIIIVHYISVDTCKRCFVIMCLSTS